MTRSCAFSMAAAALLMLPNLSVAQLIGDPRSDHLPYPVVTDPESPHVWPGAASRALSDERGRSADDSSDRAFDVYVSPTLLGRAYRDVDPALLTDVALQLAEGERILLRSRKGITAAQALQLAVKAAGDKQHKASLERLIRFAEERKDQALAAQIAAAQKLAAASRGATACLMLPVDDVDIQEYRRIRYCVQKIDQAKLTGDARCLEALEKDLDTCIPERFWDDTRKRIGEARGTIPKNGDINEPLIGFLSRLAATSRYDPERSSDEEDDTADEPVEVSGSY